MSGAEVLWLTGLCWVSLAFKSFFHVNVYKFAAAGAVVECSITKVKPPSRCQTSNKKGERQQKTDLSCQRCCRPALFLFSAWGESESTPAEARLKGPLSRTGASPVPRPLGPAGWWFVTRTGPSDQNQCCSHKKFLLGFSST